MTAQTRSLIALLAAAMVGACGGDTPTTPEPTPTLATLTLDFTYIEVIEDCDGIEGDGDFRFAVTVYPPVGAPLDAVYRESPSLGPGGKSKTIGRRTYRIDPTRNGSVQVSFVASEVDRSVFGVVYNDERLNGAYAYVNHEYNSATGTWSNLGPKSITLGSPGCRVKLSWSASSS